ncbi:MAG: hypothetical protein M1818_001947 [Claussenomyces sp. TS43310]|nr:MAG: hypothetical protein M1818_001947 [Claussenomyces sp. TS43310]
MASRRYTVVVTSFALLTISNYSVTWESRRIHEHSFLTFVILLFIIGSIFSLLSKVLARYFQNRYGDFEAIPLDDGEDDEPSDPDKRDIPGKYVGVTPLGARARRHIFYLTIACIVSRVEIQRRIVDDFQCTRPGVEITLLPLLIAAYDFLVLQRHYVNDRDYDTIDNNVFDDIYDYFTFSRGRYLIPTFLFSYGVFLLASCTSQSTYICYSSGGHGRTIASFQLFGTILDAVIIIAVTEMLRDTHDGPRRLQIIASLSLTSATVLTLAATSVFILKGKHTAMAAQPNSLYIWAAIIDCLVCAAVLLCSIYVLNDFQPLALVNTFMFLCLYPNLVSSAWSSLAAYPPYSTSAKTIGFLLFFGGFIISTHTYKVSEPLTNFSRRIPLWIQVLVMMLSVVIEGIFLSRSKVIGFSPVDFLMYNARIDSDHWLKQASSSNSLDVAVAEYQSKYRRAPPPNFDKWFAFAQERDALIIDDYDQMEKDLLPFWGLEPAVIRDRTTIQHPECDIAGIIIRGGRAQADSPCSQDTSWVADDTVEMINAFAQWLPDMNIGVNTKVTPQVAMSRKTINSLRREHYAESPSAGQFNKSFSPNADPAWKELDLERQAQWSASPTVQHKGSSYRSRYEEIESMVCPSHSRMRKRRGWNVRDFCASCTRPHSLGAFVQKWRLAADICHQPDLAAFHSFHMAQSTPSSTGYSHDTLVPLFSRSKSHGYSDIVFPGPGDYIKPTQNISGYESFVEKETALFWRGAAESTAGGVSWQGNQQQRLVNLATNYTGAIPMLLPYAANKLAYESIPAAKLGGRLHLNIGFTNITQCGGDSCAKQAKEFGILPEADPEEHLQYKYVLDLDSTGPSGNFIPFLQSDSLPFRSSIFRSWYDDRVSAWLHFIPIDIRLNDLYATLAYFTGVKGKVKGRDVVMDAKEGQAAFIASQGRKWAEKVLRKEDAEIYFFRLLLEWGRIVDDNRDHIGFKFE